MITTGNCFLTSTTLVPNITRSSSAASAARRRMVTRMMDSMTDTEVGKREIYWFDEVTSTMDKVIVKTSNSLLFLLLNCYCFRREN